MMRKRTENDVENLIKNSAFPNPEHKEALRRRLFEEDAVLDLEDLEMAAGGKGFPKKKTLEDDT